jgi:hypothetical protein
MEGEVGAGAAWMKITLEVWRMNAKVVVESPASTPNHMVLV